MTQPAGDDAASGALDLVWLPLRNAREARDVTADVRASPTDLR